MITAKEYEKQVIENSLRHNGLARIANGTEARLNELLTSALQSNAPELPVHGPTLCDALNISRNLSQALDFAAFLLKDAGYEFQFDPTTVYHRGFTTCTYCKTDPRTSC